jgi:hypothetical protein
LNDEAWGRGMLALIVAFPARDEAPEVVSERGRIYREHLDDISDHAWAHAVRESIERERWFPTVAALRDYAASAPPERKALPTPRSPEAVSESRETARQALKVGLGTLESELSARGVLPPGRRLSEAARGLPGQFARVGNSGPIHDSEERREELRRQAAEIVAGDKNHLAKTTVLA